MRQIIQTLLIAIAMAHNVNTICGKGCLNCDPADVCNQCDTINFFFNVNGTCVLQPNLGCSFTDLPGNCVLCMSNYFLFNSTCNPVGTNITNCGKYLSASSCGSCVDGYVLSNGICNALTAIIANCLSYTPSGTMCQTCKNGYVASYDGLSCLASPSVPNCQSFSNIKCQQCQGGYANAAYAYITNIQLVKPDSQQFLQTQLLNYATIISTNSATSYFPTCLYRSVKNCQTPEKFDACEVCEDGYFLDASKQCQLFPQTAIAFCSVYLTNVTCGVCQSQYYLAPNGACLPVTPIQNCAVYSQTANNHCNQCQTGFYSTSASCVARTISANILNCITPDPLSDKCLTCSGVYTTSFDGSSCVSAIPNCEVYSKTAASINCVICAQNYYFSNNLCLLSTATNCATVTGSTTCAVCTQGYYLQNQQCRAHTLISLLSCNTASTTVLNKCLTCDSNKALGTIDGMCLPVTTVLNNCQLYQSSTTCLVCDPTVSYMLNNVCYSVYLPNCALYAQNIINSCSKCVLDLTNNIIYIALEMNAPNNQCVVGNPNISNNCSVIKNTGNVEGCSSCAAKYYPKIMVSTNNAYCVPRNYYLLKGQTNNLINCKIYDQVAKACVVCLNGMVVDITGLCTFSCTSGSYLYSYIFNTAVAKDVVLTGFNKCTKTTPNYAAIGFSPSPFECYFLAESTVSPGSYYCGGCTSSQIGVLDLAVSQAFPIYTSLWPTFGLTSFSFDNRIPSIQQCVSRNPVLIGTTSTIGTVVVRAGPGVPFRFDNCRFAIKVGSVYGCGACNFGYSGIPVADLDNVGYFIQNCVQIPNCLPNIYYKGLGALTNQVTASSPTLDFFNSCHFCQNNLLPTFIRSSTTVSSITPQIKAGFYGPFSIPASTDTLVPHLKTGNLGSVSSCLPVGFNQAFVNNCAIQELKIDALITPFDNALGAANNPLCQACSPGYLPSFISGTNIITSCIFVTNCNVVLSTRFNKCDLCGSSYALAYDTTAPDGLSFYTACVELVLRDPNCVYADAFTKICAICASGYILNADGYCDNADLYSCQITSFFSPMSLNVYKSLASQGAGCQLCTDDSIAIRFSSPVQICVLSSFVDAATTTVVSKFLIQNCQNFGFDLNFNVICTNCNSGYFSTQSSIMCLRQNTSIRNCLVYTNNGQGCATCVNLYYANAFGNCVLGTNTNCVTYSSGFFNSCSVCSIGFVRVPVSANYYICVQSPSINCASWSNSITIPGLVSCDLCQSGYYYEKNILILGSTNLPICLNVPPIANCIKYENSDGVVGSSLGCIGCTASYYALNRSCVPRKNQNIPNCLSLNPLADQCQVCVFGYWIDATYNCNPFPVGISGCIKYKSLIQCLICDKNMYLQQNKCSPVPIGNLIPNCLYYDSGFNCLNCATGYFLQTLTSCVAVVAKNCLKYLDINNCSACPTNYGFIKTPTQTYCSAIEIPNCLTPDYTVLGPNFACKLCETSFYLNPQGSCVAVPAIIPFCYFYASATTCLYCFNGYVLSPLANACVINQQIQANLDPNCLYAMVTPVPFCNACKGGYFYADDGQGNTSCKPCQEVGNFCLTCDPANPKKCIACISGYSQGINGNCTKTFQPVKSLGFARRLSFLLSVWFFFFFIAGSLK